MSKIKLFFIFYLPIYLIFNFSAKCLEQPQALLVSSACVSIGQIAKSLALPLPDESEAELSKHSLVKKLLEIASNVKSSSKIKERAITSCGLLCLGESFPFAKDLVQQFLNLSKQVYHFFHATDVLA